MASHLFGDQNVARRPDVREKIKNNPNSQKTRFKKGMIPYNKGLTYKTSQTVRDYTDKKVGRKNTAEQNQHIKDGLPKDHGTKAVERIYQLIKKGKWSLMFNTKPEREMKTILEELGFVKNIDFIVQKRISKYMFDFYLIATNLVIECDGEYWHNLKEVKIRDREKEKFLKDHRYSLIRFWDYEIYNQREIVKNKISQLVNS